MLSEESDFKRLDVASKCQFGEGNVSNAQEYWEAEIFFFFSFLEPKCGGPRLIKKDLVVE